MSLCAATVVKAWMRAVLGFWLIILAPWATAGGTVILDRADFVSGSPMLPPGPGADWRQARLPQGWNAAGIQADSGWYRFRMHLPAAPEEALAVFLPRFNQSASVWVNGTWVGGCGQRDGRVAICWNRPLLAIAPASVWKVGENEIQVGLRTVPGTGMMTPIEVGDEHELRGRFESRLLSQIGYPAMISVLIVGAGMFSLALWRRREEEHLLWFALGGFAWIPYCGLLFVRDAPFDPGLFLTLCNLSADWLALTWVLFIHRFQCLEHPWVERLSFAAVAAATAAAIALGGYARIVAVVLGHMTAVLVIFSVSWHLLGKVRRGASGMAGWLFVISIAFVAVAARDTFMATGHRVLPAGYWLDLSAEPHTQWLPYLTLVYCITVGANLVRRVQLALEAAEQAIVHLEIRLSRRRKELEESFAKRRELEMVRAAEVERERIYRDLHDDLGAKLLSLTIGATSEGQADLARSALQDLRDIVSHASVSGMRLSELLGDLRAELEQRAGLADVRVSWEQPDELPDPELASNAVLSLQRILREAVSNVLRHAGASRLALQVASEDDHLDISVTDDGRGLREEPGRVGRGRGNMRSRAEHMGGRVAWETPAEGGCRVRLSMPWEKLAQLKGSV